MSGPEIGDGFWWWQYWTLVSENESEYLQHLEGTIIKILHYDGDFDWNIHVDTDPQFSWLKKNSAGDENPRGDIELEVYSPGSINVLDLPSLFPVGTRIKAYGWWVEDHAHGERTELHPLIYMISNSLDSYRFKIFMSQDYSERFVTDAWPMYESFDIPLQAPVHQVFLADIDPQASFSLQSEVLIWKNRADEMGCN